MKQKLLTWVLLLVTFTMKAQVINFTPNANTIVVTTNTTVGIGGGNFKTYLVCPGVTLSYAESSTMDTILLESGATLKFDSAISYGYASVYAKNGATVDMNFRQTGKLTYVNGVTILDTAVGPPSFFFGKQLVNGINYYYNNLPGGVGCTPNTVEDVSKEDLLRIATTPNELFLFLNKDKGKFQIKILNASGQILCTKKDVSQSEKIDISSFSTGMYRLVWHSETKAGSEAFIK